MSKTLRNLSTAATGVNAYRGPYNVLFCGTDKFALASLQRIVDRPGLCRSVQVLTPPDAPNRWQRSAKMVTVPPVKLYAQERGLESHVVPRSGLEGWQLPSPFNEPPLPSSLLITTSFGHLVPPDMLARFLPTHRLNVHPSLLPALKGAAPIQWAIARQLRKSGVSIQTLGETFDSGSILAQKQIDISPSATYLSLRDELEAVAADLLIDTLEHIPERAEAAWSQAHPPNGLQSSRAPKLQAKHAIVQWPEWDAYTIEARRRAVGYLMHLSTCLPTTKKVLRVLLHDIQLHDDASPTSNTALQKLQGQQPGTAVYDAENKVLLCRCASDTLLRINALQTEGKRVAPAEEWIKGYGNHAERFRTITFVTGSE